MTAFVLFGRSKSNILVFQIIKIIEFSVGLIFARLFFPLFIRKILIISADFLIHRIELGCIFIERKVINHSCFVIVFNKFILVSFRIVRLVFGRSFGKLF